MERFITQNQAGESDKAMVEVAAKMFIGLLDNNHALEEVKIAYNELVNVMTLETFKKVKVEEKKRQLSINPEEENIIDERINKLKNDLISSVVEIAVLADNYQKE